MSPVFKAQVLQDYPAPVSFAVIAQPRENAVLAANTLLAHRITWWSLPFALGVMLVWLVFAWSRSRASR